MSTEPEKLPVPADETTTNSLPIVVGEIRGWIRDIFFVVATAILIVIFLYQPVKVEGTSMLPELKDQERIFVNKFVYRFEKLKFESDFYNEFFISPDDMITEQVQQWLSESKIFTLVTDRNSEPPPDCVLEGWITELYGDFRNDRTPNAVMELKFLLLSANKSPGQVLFNKRYRANVPIKENIISSGKRMEPGP